MTENTITLPTSKNFIPDERCFIGTKDNLNPNAVSAKKPQSTREYGIITLPHSCLQTHRTLREATLLQLRTKTHRPVSYQNVDIERMAIDLEKTPQVISTEERAKIRSRQTQFKKSIRLWNTSVYAANTIVADYLASLGLLSSHDAIPVDVRFNPHVLHEPSRDPITGDDTHAYYPAMILPVTNLGGGIMGVYRVYLKPDGSGLEDFPENPRMLDSAMAITSSFGD